MPGTSKQANVGRPGLAVGLSCLILFGVPTATGLGQVFELVSQLRGECEGRQVENARCAIQENGGGSIGLDAAVTVVTILSR